ncbi:carbohydrate-binding family 9-like protein [Muriicola sp. Z0-33]|uniref:carbohydrate-binding family 9-like protein n=1 Tax=Muriicola sp. Z0-33 TaxID=2816957 RepID=UPI0022374A2D|nr:carbohydrate-binding family 9-like protein [Muriicola sp. Z0-33]MCW5517885.1 carbohydrate-binding family 9-like protein [Muriicola sp. Z0-33]
MFKKSSIFFGCLIGVCFIAGHIGSAQKAPRQYIANKTSEPIAIDGNDNENSWKNASWSEQFIDIEGKIQPKYPTRMKMLWDADYLYFFAQMTEPHVWASLKQRDTVIFYNNDFEIFIDPDGDTHNYYEFEMNAFNTVWDLFLTKPYRNQGKVIDSWDIQGLKSAVSVAGTINDSSDKDTGWNVEIAIPWAVITEAGSSKLPPVNQFWRINFSRVNWDFDLVDGRYMRKKGADGKFLREYNWVWSPQWVINMHEPEHWGYVFFSDDSADKKVFAIPRDEEIKWYMYRYYRKLLKAKENIEEAVGELLNASKEIDGSPIALRFEKRLSGWTLWSESPFSGDILMIAEDGEFTIEKRE